MYLLNSKDETMHMFLTYKVEVENQLNKNIKILKSDRGGEYESNNFSVMIKDGFTINEYDKCVSLKQLKIHVSLFVFVYTTC